MLNGRPVWYLDIENEASIEMPASRVQV